ncbi:MAG: antibiotic biosynthesis monooxygenase [Okeania sp. SIO3B5]|uniref:putative quinol monooxygenase n=1 Tax=Okeania sp. SIO3B5 TaxID=2607811 RepID=UPI0013FF1517|nr:putative quinol monooxygenase [Okeania sp. SIO3B5]NEO56702.1 antibiotic biosynthesis monooxygenase [Okeania sp. SIO3B5]
MFFQSHSRFKLLGKSIFVLLLLTSVYGCEKVVSSTVGNSQAIAVEKIELPYKLVAQLIAQDGKGTDFSGVPILASSRFVIMPDKREEFIKLINDIIPKVRKESGNISYSLYEEINNPNSFLIFEEWKSRKSLNKFIGTDINKIKIEKIRQISVEEPSFKVLHFQSIDFKL